MYVCICIYIYIYIYTLYYQQVAEVSSGPLPGAPASCWWTAKAAISLSLSIYIYIYISTHPYITTMFFMAHCAHHQAHSQLHKFPARDQSRPCPFALFWPAACLKSLSWFCAWSFGRGSSQDYMFMSFCATRSTTCIDVCIVAVSVPILMLQSSITDMHT